MQVSCGSLEEFLANLRDNSVKLGVVYFSTDRQSLDAGDLQDSVRFAVSIQASAIMELPNDGGEYLIECEEDCGMDYRDVSDTCIGSERANYLRKKLYDFCDDCGLNVRPGIVGI